MFKFLGSFLLFIILFISFNIVDARGSTYDSFSNYIFLNEEARDIDGHYLENGYGKFSINSKFEVFTYFDSNDNYLIHIPDYIKLNYNDVSEPFIYVFDNYFFIVDEINNLLFDNCIFEVLYLDSFEVILSTHPIKYNKIDNYFYPDFSVGSSEITLKIHDIPFSFFKSLNFGCFYSYLFGRFELIEFIDIDREYIVPISIELVNDKGKGLYGYNPDFYNTFVYFNFPFEFDFIYSLDVSYSYSTRMGAGNLTSEILFWLFPETAYFDDGVVDIHETYTFSDYYVDYIGFIFTKKYYINRFNYGNFIFENNSYNFKLQTEDIYLLYHPYEAQGIRFYNDSFNVANIKYSYKGINYLSVNVDVEPSINPKLLPTQSFFSKIFSKLLNIIRNFIIIPIIFIIFLIVNYFVKKYKKKKKK